MVISGRSTLCWIFTRHRAECSLEKYFFQSLSFQSETELEFWSRCFVSYLYSFVVYLYVNGSESITSVGEERANLSAVVYL